MNKPENRNKFTVTTIITALLLAMAYLVVCHAFAGSERAVLVIAGEDEGQEEKFNNEAEINHLMTERISNLLTGIETAEKGGNFRTSLKYYQEVFDVAGDEIIGPLAGTAHTYTQARTYCLDRLNSLDERQKTLYETFYNGDAKKLLDAALKENNREMLLEIVRRYMMTSSGSAALKKLGWLAFEAEKYDEAVSYWRYMLRYHPSEMDAAMVAGMAAACGKLNSREGLEAAARVAETRFPRARVTAGGRVVPLIRFINGKISSLGPAESTNTTWWTMPGGDRSQQRFVAEKPGLKQKVWSYKFPVSVTGVQRYTAVYDDVVYVNNGEEVVALSLWNGGLLWKHKTPRAAFKRAHDIYVRELRIEIPGQPVTVITNAGALFRPAGVTVHKDTVYTVSYGQLQAIRRDTGRLLWRAEVVDSDMKGERGVAEFFFAVSPLRIDDNIYSAGVRRCGDSQTFIAYCHDAYNGKIKWRKELTSERMDILQRPMVVVRRGTIDHLDLHTTPAFPCESDGVLYVTTGGGSVAAIDGRNGDLIWLTLYDRGKGGRAVPLMRNGRDYCPSVAADGKLVTAPADSMYIYVFEMKTGKPLWRMPRRSEDGDFRHIVAVEPDKRIVFLAGDRVAAYDLEKGTIRAESSGLVGSAIGPGFIYNNDLYIPTEEGLFTADIEASLKSGRMELKQVMAWKDILTDEELKDPAAVRKTAGNIVTAEGALVVTSGSRVTVLYDAARRISELNEAIRKGDKDGVLIFKRGLVRASGAVGGKVKALGDYQAAMRKLRRYARSVERFNEENYVHYYGSPSATIRPYGRMVMQARSDTARVAFEEAARLLGQNPAGIKYRDLGEEDVEPGAERKAVKFLEISQANAIDADLYVKSKLVLLELAKKAGNWQEYVDLLVEMSREWGRQSYDFSRYAPDLITREINLFCSSAIAETLKVHGKHLYEKYDRKAAELLKSAKRKRNINELLDVARLYPNSAAAPEALLTAMNLAGKSGDDRQRAYIAMEYMVGFPEGAGGFTAMAAYAESLENLGDFAGARRLFHEMDSLARAAGVSRFVISGGKQNISTYVEGKLAALKGKRGRYTIDIPLKNARFRQVAELESADYADALMLEPTGTAPPGLEGRVFLLFAQTGSKVLVLRCLDENTLQEVWSAEIGAALGEKLRTAVARSLAAGSAILRHSALGYSGNSLVLNLGSLLMSFNPRNGGLRWAMGSKLDYLMICITDRTVYFARRTKNTRVYAIDARSGRIVWEQELFRPICGKIVAACDRLLVTTARNDKKAWADLILLEKRTGRIKGVVENLKYIPLQDDLRALSFSLSFPRYTAPLVAPVDAERVLVRGGDGLGMYGLEKGDVIWENRHAGAFGTQIPNPRRYILLASLSRIPFPATLAVDGGICVVTADHNARLKVYDLANGKLLAGISPPAGWTLLEWALDRGRLEVFSVQRCEETGLGYNFLQNAFDARTGKLLYSNLFPTGTFIYRPLLTGNHVITAKEDLAEQHSRDVQIVVYSNRSGKIAASPVQLEGVGFAPYSGLFGRGRRLVVKGEWKIAVLAIEQEKQED